MDLPAESWSQVISVGAAEAVAVAVADGAFRAGVPLAGDGGAFGGAHEAKVQMRAARARRIEISGPVVAREYRSNGVPRGTAACTQ
jgi:hypothetical protein